MYQYQHLQPLELWGGVECTLTRVGDRYYDQLIKNGHAFRVSDLDRFAELGFRTLRYPILWERIAPNGLDTADWSWADERLGRLRELGIRPNVGLLHHGSGPPDTNLLDPEFPAKFARYARAVAERYPWVELYSPVNEPLTTARFSYLYGVWYPRIRDDRLFLQALLNQCRATVLAMREIRRVNPNAQLVQTEDLARVYSTPALAYQADFENERRWLTFDLLSGCVNPDHPLWDYLAWLGIPEAELTQFLDEPSPPDIFGCDYYLTGERFLDEDWERYPEETHATNGKHKYADVEAVRVLPEGTGDLAALLKEVWERYHKPLAVTEAHLGCTREEQLRWLAQVWRTAKQLHGEGVDVRAVTAWALLGTFDWDSLLTRDDNHYEPGLFDVRSTPPRPTALAKLAQHLATGAAYEHPVLQVPGWWHRPERLLYAQVPPSDASYLPDVPPLLITGARGTLASAFAHICRERGLAYYLLTRDKLDITDPESIKFAVEQYKPWAIINAAGYTRIDQAETDPERCFRDNTRGPALLAITCAQHGIPLVTFSSDLVFDGKQTIPYVESDAPLPLNIYGQSKAAAEKAVLEILPTALVVRSGALFGPWDKHNFVTGTLRALHAGHRVVVPQDAVISPTYIPDLVHNTLDLLVDGESGIWHLANQGAVSWFDWAVQVASAAGLDKNLISGKPIAELASAQRPLFSALASERGALMGTRQDALSSYIAQAQPLTRDYNSPVQAEPFEYVILAQKSASYDFSKR